MNLKEEGIRNWILAGASTVVADPNQKDTYIVDGDFYDNQLVGNIVRPVAAVGDRRPGRRERAARRVVLELPDVDRWTARWATSAYSTSRSSSRCAPRSPTDDGDHPRRPLAQHDR